MAAIRVFLTTYKRPQLLRRALASLCAQTFADWACELHNDAPGDDEPRAILEELAQNDSRFTYHAHSRNWGPVAAFNHAFQGGPEPFASLLEDDNWWEPDFLATAYAVLTAHSEAAMAWSNMRVWQEERDGSWRETGEVLWPAAKEMGTAVMFRFPEIVQAVEALHSNGAMVFRPQSFFPKTVPLETPFAIIEHIRERATHGSLILIPRPLANYAQTLTTARSVDRAHWAQSQILVTASFMATTAASVEDWGRLYAVQRARRPRATSPLLLASLVMGNGPALRAARPSDWAWLVTGALRHPFVFWQTCRFRHHHQAMWAWLKTAGSQKSVAHATVWSKESFQAQ